MNQKALESGVILVVGLVALILMAILGDDPGHLQTNYCKMVTIYIESDGEFGWPDYKGNYTEICDVE